MLNSHFLFGIVIGVALVWAYHKFGSGLRGGGQKGNQ